jgi:drug/metabolite transporter (DMT)-like permease
MSGIAWAIAGGIGFGVFQATYRRVNRVIDAFTATFLLLVGATISLAVVAGLTQDLGLLTEAPLSAYIAYVLTGTVHFFFGWTFFNLSQRQVGASRTGVVVAATPLVGSVMAWIFISEPLPLITVLGILLVGGGVALITGSEPSASGGAGSVPWAGLGASLAWGTSPLLIRWGLEGLPSPLLGLVVGLSATSLLYGIGIGARSRRQDVPALPRGILPWVALSSILVAAALASQWKAWELIEISVAITLLQLATPTVVILAPLIAGGEAERPNLRVVAGMAAIVGGSMLVVWTGGS